MPKITGSAGIIGIKISCGATELQSTGHDSSEVCQVIISFKFPEQDEPTQIGVPLYGKNCKGPAEPAGKNSPNNPAPGVGGGGTGRGENTRDLATRIAAALKTEVGKNNLITARAADIVIETRTIIKRAKRTAGGRGAGRPAARTDAPKFEADDYLRIIIPGAESVDGTAQNDGGKVRLFGFGPAGGGVGIAAPKGPPRWIEPIPVTHPTKGWKGPRRYGPRPRGNCKCEDAIGPEATPSDDKKIVLQDSPTEHPDPGDTGWQPLGHGVG